MHVDSEKNRKEHHERKVQMTMHLSAAFFHGHGIVIALPQGSVPEMRARRIMKSFSKMFSPLVLPDNWPPHVTIAAGKWLDRASAINCAKLIAKMHESFEIELHTPKVDGFVEGAQSAMHDP